MHDKHQSPIIGAIFVTYFVNTVWNPALHFKLSRISLGQVICVESNRTWHTRQGCISIMI